MSPAEENRDLLSATFIDVEQTLAIVKPDAIEKLNEIEEIILKQGFSILKKRRVRLTPEQASEFYAEHYGKMFFPSLVAFMSSGESQAMVLSRKEAVSYWRAVIGPTHTAKAREEAPHSIRAIYGSDHQRNAVHGSDCRASAEKEIRYFFPDSIIEPLPSADEVKDYLVKHVNPTLLKGLTALCRRKPGDPLIWLADWLTDNNPNKPRIDEPDGYVVEEPAV